jgi:hypothetical protein
MRLTCGGPLTAVPRGPGRRRGRLALCRGDRSGGSGSGLLLLRAEFPRCGVDGALRSGGSVIDSSVANRRAVQPRGNRGAQRMDCPGGREGVQVSARGEAPDYRAACLPPLAPDKRDGRDDSWPAATVIGRTCATAARATKVANQHADPLPRACSGARTMRHDSAPQPRRAWQLVAVGEIALHLSLSHDEVLT